MNQASGRWFLAVALSLLGSFDPLHAQPAGVRPCGELAALTIEDVAITSATDVPAGSFTPKFDWDRQDTLMYYDGVAKAMGGLPTTQEFFRFFPGAWHGALQWRPRAGGIRCAGGARSMGRERGSPLAVARHAQLERRRRSHASAVRLSRGRPPSRRQRRRGVQLHVRPGSLLDAVERPIAIPHAGRCWDSPPFVLLLALILSRPVSPLVALIVVPTARGARRRVRAGDRAVHRRAASSRRPRSPAMFVFAILYFGIMTDAGLLDPIVDRILRVVGTRPRRIVVGTALLALLVHLDGSGAVTFLVTIPAMLPLYERLGMDRRVLACVASLAAGVNFLPWTGPTVARLGRRCTSRRRSCSGRSSRSRPSGWSSSSWSRTGWAGGRSGGSGCADDRARPAGAVERSRPRNCRRCGGRASSGPTWCSRWS